MSDNHFSEKPENQSEDKKEALNNAHDRCFREMMRQEKMVAAFFKAYLPKPLQNKLDWEALKLEEASFIAEDLKSYEGDIL